MNKKKYIDYIFLIAGKSFSSGFLNCWTNTVRFFEKNNISFVSAISYSPIISKTRNSLVGNFPSTMDSNIYSTVPFNGELTCKKVIFIDDDMYWTLDDIKKLIESDKDVISGIYLTADKETVALVSSEGGRIPLNNLQNYNEPFEVEAAGLGFMACTMKVLEDMQFPWFDTPWSTEKEGQIIVSEDVFFCKKATENGYKIYADPSILVGHEKTSILLLK